MTDITISPVGWYVASYLLRFVELGSDNKDEPDARFLSWENTVLVRAASLAEAYDKTVAIGNAAGKPYKGGPDGIDVQWVFEGVTQLLPVYEELEDGAEIMWVEHRSRKLRTLRKWVRPKKELLQSLPRQQRGY